MIKAPEALKGQLGDQTAKGGVLGVICYIAWKSGVDAGVIALATPIMSAVLAWASTKVGSPDMASFFEVAKKVVAEVDKLDGQTPKPAAKAVAKKKAPAKKPVSKKN